MEKDLRFAQKSSRCKEAALEDPAQGGVGEVVGGRGATGADHLCRSRILPQQPTATGEPVCGALCLACAPLKYLRG